MHALDPAHRKATWWLVALVGLTLALLLAMPAISHAEEANPNNYSCLGGVANGTPEVGSDEQQVKYSFYCNGPITGYQLQSQIPLTGVQSPPLVTATGTLPSAPAGAPLTDTFSCSGEVPGYAVNCIGATKAGYETVTGQFAIGSKLCVEPRVDPLLTVTYAYLEKGAIVQAISGPYDLGRPAGCPPNANSGFNRLNPKPVAVATKGKKSKKADSKKKAAPKKK
ncbi:MAG TPA: hypothetical protein VGL68_07345 [Solirubrobacteraceae bacterium]